MAQPEPPAVARDGLPARQTGPWVHDKLYYLERYLSIFTKGVRRKWQGKLSYIDLFSGPGRSIIRSTGEEVDGSPFVALNCDFARTWRTPKRIFVNSMSDLFHDRIPDDYIVAVAAVMVEACWHTYQVLTKRSDRMRDLLKTQLQFAAGQSHIWWGVSVENRRSGLPRIKHLQAAPASVRFLSIEPLLEDLGRLELSGIHWVIVGGESGFGARPMKREWVTAIRRQCRQAGIPFFFKQWGGVRKSHAGRLLDGRTYDEMPVNYVSAKQESSAPCSVTST